MTEATLDHGLRATGVTKSFGPIAASDHVDLHLRCGRIHALLGENGAGKSTLVGILNGRLRPDEGSVILDGEPLRGGDARLAAARGIATVHQDLALVPSMTGLENIALALGSSVNQALRTRVAEAERRLGLSARMNSPVLSLELPQRQRIELIRALCQAPSVLILDEPTTFLPPTAVEPFLMRMRELADAGLAVLLITHRLDEARLVADEVTVLRAGKVVGTFNRGRFPSNEELAVAMVGESIPQPNVNGVAAGETLIEVTGLRVDDDRRTCVDGVDLTVQRGEIVGVAGVDGNGQDELLEAIGGLRDAVDGKLVYGGRDIARIPYAHRADLGIQFVSGERRRDGIVPTFTVAEHFRYVLGSCVDERLGAVLAEHGVTPPDPSMLAQNLSGGNQQKMVLARALQRDSQLLLLTYPTQGLDVLAAAQLRLLLMERAASGLAVVIASSDLDELLTISHRVVVMNRGRIVGEQTSANLDRQQLASWFTRGDPR